MKTSSASKTQNPKSVAVPKTGGYPNNIASTQTMKTRGTGAATKGTKFSGRTA